jgi:glutathionylspermidine synthase
VPVGSDGELGDWKGVHYIFDKYGRKANIVWMLFPWKWFLADKIAPALCDNMLLLDGTMWIEPIWKLLWDKKIVLALLWDRFKDDPVRSKLLIPAYFPGEQPDDLGDYIDKPDSGREGNGMKVFSGGDVLTSGPDEVYSGDDGPDGSRVLQQYCPPPTFDDELEGTTYYAVLGLYAVRDKMSTVFVRESTGPITTNGATGNQRTYFAPLVVSGYIPSDFEIDEDAIDD